MNTTLAVNTSLLAVLAVGLATGCVVRERTVYQPAPPPVAYVAPAPPPEAVVVDAAPPAPIVEVIPSAPRPGFFWVPGAWVWRGHHWVWIRGHYAHPPRAGAVWLGGHYENRGGVNVYIGGTWR